MRHPTLYKRTSGGKIEQWTVWTEDDVIVTEHGLVNGKLQTARKQAKPKNVGRVNATSGSEQAELEAKSAWEVKRTRKGYTIDPQAADRGENEGDGGIRPMLAKKFSEHGKKIKYPCYAQPKLDGIRCIATVSYNGLVYLWSREQKQIVSVPHIADAIVKLGLPPGTVLDGELYNHELKDDFESIVSAVRKQAHCTDEEAQLIQYHIYDLPRHARLSENAPFSERTKTLHAELQWRGVGNSGVDPSLSPLRLVETILIENENELDGHQERCQIDGYEGNMARNADGPYEEGKRSTHLQKRKEFIDGEFDIVGVYEGTGKMAGLAMFVCSMEPGHRKLSREEAEELARRDFEGTKLFGCKKDGELEALRPYLTDESLWWPKKLTVEYFSLTRKRKVPRFPVGKAIRDYE